MKKGASTRMLTRLAPPVDHSRRSPRDGWAVRATARDEVGRQRPHDSHTFTPAPLPEVEGSRAHHGASPDHSCFPLTRAFRGPPLNARSAAQPRGAK